MAYLRGDNYIWGDADGVHFWSANGQDGWEETGWHTGVLERHAGENTAPSGTWVPAPAIDAFVLMRFAEILAEGRFSEIAEKIVADHTDTDPIDVLGKYLEPNGHYIGHPGRYVAKLKACMEKVRSEEE